ncbi:MotE family protein [Sulfurimonas autotrophica]|uniref:PDP protein n=1 Tax=Sulfurimonas autotrophica (strain ATCC BAA-671 / DSM 16294 / JCM 11897 / OK10) TaxID=563040 RepID=E0URC5_SULAO|nr:PDP protein [Sulfurimonas autotrophica]ADN10011.1 PDP protein [Sulfurimonas autotrophica DSM 16294]
MKYILLIALLYSSLFSMQNSDKLFECTKIFKERKNELLVELERIDEQKQALNALKTATEDLLKKKEAKLALKEEAVNAKLAQVSQKEKAIKEMVEKNSKILKELQSTKMSKISQTFAKMKAGAAANVLSDMDSKEAGSILQSLKPKVVGKILTKMDPKKASELTQLLAK